MTQLDAAPAAAHHDPVAHDDAAAAPDDDLLRIETAIGIIVRHATLPSTWTSMFERAGVAPPPGVDRSAYPLLVRIARYGPIRPSVIAHQTGVKISTISRQLAELERHALVQRSVDPSDARASVFILDDAGRDLLSRLRTVRRESLAGRLEHWSERDLNRLASLLTRFVHDLAPELS